MMLIVIAVIAFLLLGGKNLLFGGGDNTGSDLTSILTDTSTSTQTQTGTGNGGNSIMNLLSGFMGSTSSSSYDFSGMLSGLTGGGMSGITDTTDLTTTTTNASNSSYQQYFTTTLENNSQEADTTVASGSRDKYTVIEGNNKDTMTILVYMCGADLESQNGMATSDLKEMLNAKISDKVNLIVFTGGARRWRNNVVSSSVNQIYQIKDGSLTRLEQDYGTASMTNPSTLASFIKYGRIIIKFFNTK